jgi:hypothetical protein
LVAAWLDKSHLEVGSKITNNYGIKIQAHIHKPKVAGRISKGNRVVLVQYYLISSPYMLHFSGSFF